MSRYSRCVALVKSGVLSSLVQPERCRTLRELMLPTSPKSMITRLEQFRKFKKASFLRSPIDEWTCDKLVHPERSSLSRFMILEKSGVSIRYLELLKSTLFKLGQLCEKGINNHPLASNLKTSFHYFSFSFGVLSKLKTIT